MPCSCCGCYFLILRQLLRQTLARVWARGEACKKHLLRKTWLWCRQHPKNYGTLMLVTQQLQQGNKMAKINVKKKLVHELMAIWDTYSEWNCRNHKKWCYSAEHWDLGSVVWVFFLIRGGTRSLRMPTLRLASQAGPMRNPREGTSVVLRDTIRLTWWCV